ncbi:MAG: hypothetical protein ACRDCE_09490 [Cetobacterium sp.]|uniref:hypothetical protein n=1 Tax=Cetobacterium sp. TaxID=2071632 RepID=UPI003EE623E6
MTTAEIESTLCVLVEKLESALAALDGDYLVFVDDDSAYQIEQPRRNYINLVPCGLCDATRYRADMHYHNDIKFRLDAVGVDVKCVSLRLALVELIKEAKDSIKDVALVC